MREFEENIRRVDPYVPGDQPRQKVVKLNTNENPYPPAPGVGEALKNMDPEKLKLYPDPKSTDLVRALAEHYHVREDQVFLGAGSDDVLSMCFLTFFNSKRPIFFPDVTYSFYPVWAELYRIPYECKKLDDDFRLKKEDYYRPNGGIIFPNPNAPTGLYEPMDVVEDIVSHNPESIVIVDEAYVDFAGRSAIELVSEYDNLIVVQTFSKSRSLAGLRVGYAIANPKLIAYLNDVRYSFNSYNMNLTAQVLGLASLQDESYFRENLKKITTTREWAKGELEKLGFVCLDSQANFLFVTHPHYDAYEMYKELKTAGIYVRHFDKPRTRNYLRISIGTEEEMQLLFAFFKHYVSSEDKQDT